MLKMSIVLSLLFHKTNAIVLSSLITNNAQNVSCSIVIVILLKFTPHMEIKDKSKTKSKNQNPRQKSESQNPRQIQDKF